MQKILIVEDDQQLQLAYSIILKKEGFDVVTAGDGRQALELCKSDRPHLILLDIRMPNMGGLEFLEHYQQLPVQTAKIIAFSNMEVPEHVKKSYQLGVSRYLLKSSMSPTELVEVIRQTI